MACHPEPFAVILSEAKNLALPLRVNSAKDLALTDPVELHKGDGFGFFVEGRGCVTCFARSCQGWAERGSSLRSE